MIGTGAAHLSPEAQEIVLTGSHHDGPAGLWRHLSSG